MTEANKSASSLDLNKNNMIDLPFSFNQFASWRKSNSTVEQSTVIEQNIEIPLQRKYIKIWIPETIRVKFFRNQDISNVIEQWYKIGIHIDESGEVVDETFISNLIRLINENRISNVFDSIDTTKDGEIDFEEFRRRVIGQTFMKEGNVLAIQYDNSEAKRIGFSGQETTRRSMSIPPQGKYIKIWITESIRIKYSINIEQWYKLGIYIHESGEPVDETFVSYLVRLINENRIGHIFDLIQVTINGKVDLQEFRRIVIEQFVDVPLQKTYTSSYPPQGKYIKIWITETIRIKYSINIEQWYKLGIYIHESGEPVDETFVSYLVRLIKLNRISNIFDTIQVNQDGKIDFEEFRRRVMEQYTDIPLQQTYTFSYPSQGKYIKIWIPEAIRIKYFGNKDISKVAQELYQIGVHLDARDGAEVNEMFVSNLLDLIKEKRLKDIFDSIDRNKDGKIDFDEFKAKMISSNPSSSSFNANLLYSYAS